MTSPTERLYNLLPAVYRSRDAAQGEPLRALMATFERELDAIAADTETTLDNWFIETCEAWVIPYLAQMLGVEGMRPIDGWSQRGFVANTVAYRRRKGTAAVVEQLALDITGFRARAVEYFQRTATTVHTRHVRGAGDIPSLRGNIDIRNPRRLETLDGPFDPHAHTPDVRPIENGRGRYNLPNLGIHLWRLRSFAVSRVTARAIPGETGWFRFDPHGADVPLFNIPQTETTITSLAEAVNVPHVLSRLELRAEQDGDVDPAYLGADPAFAVRTLSAGVESAPFAIDICHLGDVPGGLPAHRPPVGTVSVDPELGRMVFALADVPPAAADPFEVLVDYAYGAPGTVGSGTYDRSESVAEQLGEDIVTFERYVSRDATLMAELGAVETIEQAVTAWNAHATIAGTGAVGRIVVLGGRTNPELDPIVPQSRTYEAPASTITVPEGARLHILASNVDRQPDGQGGFVETLVPTGVRPAVVGDILVEGGLALAEQARPGGLFLNGLSVEGRVVVAPGDLESLELVHCTVHPSHGGIEVESSPGSTNAALRIRLFRSICGSVTAPGGITSFSATDSIIDGEPDAIELPGTELDLRGVTVLGGTSGRTITASNSILDGPVVAEQHQAGCLRFCFAPRGGNSPRRYRCQPDLAIADAQGPQQVATARARMRPGYMTNDPSQPGYALLRPDVPDGIRTGAEDGAEMGAFQHLQFALRQANLRRALRQYLRFGLAAGQLIES